MPKVDLGTISYLKSSIFGKNSHSFLIFFHNPTSKAPASSREHHPPHKVPYLESIVTVHHVFLSSP
jgi:hypothetical protein